MRYAILFSGMSLRRHVNGLEFCYRVLVDRLGFEAAHIHVLSYDGSLRAFGDGESPPVGLWPGNGTPYRMVVNAEGSSTAFRHALEVVGGKLAPKDELFINTTGHGGHHGNGCGPDLITYPDCTRYRCRDFCNDLASLPPHASLVVLMAQCFSGGFNQEVIGASRAASTFIASATSQIGQSFMSFEDPNWDPFQRNWLAALAGQDVDGTPLVIPGKGHTEDPIRNVRDAFEYALTCPKRGLYDSPECAANPDTAGALTLR